MGEREGTGASGCPAVVPFRPDAGGTRKFIKEGQTSRNARKRYKNMKFIIFNPAVPALSGNKNRDPFPKINLFPAIRWDSPVCSCMHPLAIIIGTNVNFLKCYLKVF